MSDLRICVIGDIIGKPGRVAIMQSLPDLRHELQLAAQVGQLVEDGQASGLADDVADDADAELAHLA